MNSNAIICDCWTNYCGAGRTLTAGLGNEAALNRMKQVKIVVFQFAQFEEVQTGEPSLFQK